MTKRWEFHPLADMFPLMEGEAFDELVEDIRLHGQKELAYVYEGKVLDGRNRANACAALGIELVTIPWNGPSDPVACIASLNLHRRHLNTSQRAAVAAKLATRGPGRPNGKPAEMPVILTQSQAAAALQVSERSVRNAVKVEQEGASALKDALAAGDIPVTTAARIAGLPKSEQKTVVKQIVTGVKSNAAPKPKAPEKPKGLFAKAQKLMGQLVREVDAIASAQGGPSPRSRGLLELMNTVNGKFLEWKRASR